VSPHSNWPTTSQGGPGSERNVFVHVPAAGASKGRALVGLGVGATVLSRSITRRPN
jgi:hypothetical protein